jgi:hypothetical protein
MKVYLNTYSHYPVISLCTEQNSAFDMVVDIPANLVKQYQDAEEKYTKIQEKLLSYYKEAKKG